MKHKLQGTWFGEYTINKGTSKKPDVKQFCFELKIKGDEDEFNGRFIDKTLKTQESIIRGFEDNGFISFIRETGFEPEISEFLYIEAKSREKQYIFNFSGYYNQDENSYEGIWELPIDEENEGLQDSQIVEYRTGAWYLRKL